MRLAVCRLDHNVPKADLAPLQPCLSRPCRTAIGIRTKDGVVLAVEKLVHSELLLKGTNRRIQTIDPHVGMVRLLATWSFAEEG